MADIGGSCTFDQTVDTEQELITAGPTVNTPRAGANFTTYSTTRLTVPPYVDKGCWSVTAAIPAGGTAADQRAIVEGAQADKVTELRNELVGNPAVVPGIGGWSWLTGVLISDRTQHKTTAFALKSNNTGAPGAQEIVVASWAVYTPGAVGDDMAKEALTIVDNGLISCITMPAP